MFGLSVLWLSVLWLWCFYWGAGYWRRVSFGFSVYGMNVGDEISVFVDGVPVVVEVLGCELLEPMGFDERWSCRVSADGVMGVVVVSVFAGAVVDQSSFIEV